MDLLIVRFEMRNTRPLVSRLCVSAAISSSASYELKVSRWGRSRVSVNMTHAFLGACQVFNFCAVLQLFEAVLSLRNDFQ